MLEVKDLYVGYYKDLNILQGVHLHARKSEITAVLGPNGVGKSTLLKALFGFVRPQQGQILLAGQEIKGYPSHELVNLGVSYIPQRQNVFSDMTVEENLEMGAWTFRRDRNRVQEKIEANYERFPTSTSAETFPGRTAVRRHATHGGDRPGYDDQPQASVGR